MRSLCSGVIAACLLTSQMAAAQQCTRSRDKAAFDTTALKSELMVTALTCDFRAQYNAFIVRYRKDLVAQDRALTGYFVRSFGRRGTREHDDYITALANVQSEAGLRLGTMFCYSRVGLFDKVMALGSAAELPGFAAVQGLNQPLTLVECAAHETRTRTASLEATGRPARPKVTGAR